VDPHTSISVNQSHIRLSQSTSLTYAIWSHIHIHLSWMSWPTYSSLDRPFHKRLSQSSKRTYTFLRHQDSHTPILYVRYSCVPALLYECIQACMQDTYLIYGTRVYLALGLYHHQLSCEVRAYISSKKKKFRRRASRSSSNNFFFLFFSRINCH
jgi:hypothetical protein